MVRFARLLAAALMAGGAMPLAAATGPSDAEIAHIAHTAGALDAAAAKQALAKTSDPQVRAFAETMLRDHEAVNGKALALVSKLKVTPADNTTSQALAAQAKATETKLATLDGKAFDRAYVDNEVAFHRTVNDALKSTLIPSADNGELKALLETGLVLFGEHQEHAEHLATRLR